MLPKTYGLALKAEPYPQLWASRFLRTTPHPWLQHDACGLAIQYKALNLFSVLISGSILWTAAVQRAVCSKALGSKKAGIRGPSHTGLILTIQLYRVQCTLCWPVSPCRQVNTKQTCYLQKSGINPRQLTMLFIPKLLYNVTATC